MDHSPGPRRWRPGPLALGVLLLGGLLTLGLGASRAGMRPDATLPKVGGWLWSSSWAWPLLAALTLIVLSSPLAHRRWRRHVSRIPPAIGIFAGLVGLTSLAIRWPGATLLAVSTVVAVGLLAVWVLVMPSRLAPSLTPEALRPLSDDRERLEVADARAKLQNDLRTTALQAVGGLAVLAGAVLGFQQLTEDRQQADATRELTVQGQASERFTSAIEQLGSERREVQLGGIYGLEQIAQLAPNNRLAVTEVLVAYLQRRAVQPVKLPAVPQYLPELRVRVPDTQAALTVLGRRQTTPNDPPLVLRRLDFLGADLSRGNFSRADLSGTDLRTAKLVAANLSGTNLDRARLDDAELSEANLRGAQLNEANLERAELQKADLSGAELIGVNLTLAELPNATLNKATLALALLNHAKLGGSKLVGAELSESQLENADLTKADLTGAILQRAYLGSADLSGANLSGADLSYANLSGAVLRDAIADQRTTKWPDGFDWQGAGVRLQQSNNP